MWIDIDDAVRIYARMLRAASARLEAPRPALEMADHLRAKGDRSGVKAWKAVASELIPDEVRRDRGTPQNCPPNEADRMKISTFMRFGCAQDCFKE